MAAVLLGVVELWLSQGRRPIRARTGSGASAALICAPQPGVSPRTYTGAKIRPPLVFQREHAGLLRNPSTSSSPLTGTEPGAGRHRWR